jgi:hypothetical protein
VNHFVSAAAQQANLGDIYFCLSLQANCEKTEKGTLKSKRSADGALLLKAIWLDVDVKEPPKGYATFPEAAQAIAQFCKDAKLPAPTATVKSGGGLHVYWISDTPLTPADWRPYAMGLRMLAEKHGLRCDYGVTTDAARVLRVPGTFNYKTKPPKAVELAWLAPDDLSFATALDKLPAAANLNPSFTVTVKEAGFDLSAFPAKANNAALTGKLSDGITHDDIPLAPLPIIKGCPLWLEAIKTHGKDHQQPIWNLLILGSTFMESGTKIAHAISDWHPGYEFNATDQMFARKLRERQEKKLGWPSCAAFQNEGCKLCATCPHFGKNKSPLNLGMPVRPPSKAISVAGSASAANPVAELRDLCARGATLEEMLQEFNKRYAVVKYGSEVLVASITADEIATMKEQDFHKSFANVVVYQESSTGRRKAHVSKEWFQWKGRRQYMGRGIVFDPSGPPDVPDDMLNLWRGFGIAPKRGDWSQLRKHIFEVICSANQLHYEYLIKWLAYAVQRLDRPVGIAVALRGEQGAGKGILGRTLGKIFGKHFAHIARGDQLTGQFNATVATACFVFLDEALWAGDKKAEGVLKALITEPTLMLEAKYRDPVMVENRLRIMVASNNDWCVPAGPGDRRWFVLDVANTRAGMQHKEYWEPLYSEIRNGGAEAMLYDLLAMDLRWFDVWAIPATAAKAEQQAHTFRDIEAWVYQVLQDGAVGPWHWQKTGLSIEKDAAYGHYVEFTKLHREYRAQGKGEWSKKLRRLLGSTVNDSRRSTGNDRTRHLEFGPLDQCRTVFTDKTGAQGLEWDDETEEPSKNAAGVPIDGRTGAGFPNPTNATLPKCLKAQLAVAAADAEAVRSMIAAKQEETTN